MGTMGRGNSSRDLFGEKEDKPLPYASFLAEGRERTRKMNKGVVECVRAKVNIAEEKSRPLGGCVSSN